jgi:hypothetical protein
MHPSGAFSNAFRDKGHGMFPADAGLGGPPRPGVGPRHPQRVTPRGTPEVIFASGLEIR